MGFRVVYWDNGKESDHDYIILEYMYICIYIYIIGVIEGQWKRIWKLVLGFRVVVMAIEIQQYSSEY